MLWRGQSASAHRCTPLLFSLHRSQCGACRKRRSLGAGKKVAAIGAATEASLSFSVSLSHVVSVSPRPSPVLARTPAVQPSLPPPLPVSHPKFPLPPVGSVALSILGFGVVSSPRVGFGVGRRRRRRSREGRPEISCRREFGRALCGRRGAG